MKTIKIISLLTCFVLLFTLAACDSKENEDKVTIDNVLQNAVSVHINGAEVNTVEASYGAFEGKQGDYIEFRFAGPQKIDTVFITEKTATVRQFNIYATIDDKETLIYTGKHILAENIKFEPVNATALKVEIVNTEIGNDNFVIQNISAYDLTEVQFNVD